MPVFLHCAAKTCASDTLAFLADSFARLPQPKFTDRAETWARHRDKAVLMGLLERCCAEEPKSFGCIDKAIAELNADKDGLDVFLQQQNYRLAYWRVASEDIGYRRFFDINTLIGVRVEREQVLLETHERILQWLREGTIDGVRVDHADGLRDPQQYFERLRQTAPRAYVVAEKILQREERLQAGWPIHGCTGYEFIDAANGLLLCPEGLSKIEEFYREFTGETTDFDVMAREKKLAVEQEGLGSDVTRLTTLFLEICENDRNHRDYTRPEIRRAIREIAGCFPVYRTYVSPERREVSEADSQYIHTALEAARANRTDIDARLFDFIGDVLMLRRRGTLESEFLLRFQQFTSPVMAKGVEDTTLYCFNRLVGLNEVGGEVAKPVLTVAEFHARNAEWQKTHPLRMVTLTTHDTKRSEDVRARLVALTEMPDEFRAAVERWSALNAKSRDGALALDRNTEYFFYQTVIGAWPLTEERAIAYMEKAVREAKAHTTWTNNNAEYEEGMRSFLRSAFGNAEFVAEVERFVAALDEWGHVNSLVQTLLKYTVPGVPDLYQGSELWDYRLVDPDNRTPVDFKLRCRLLEELQHCSTADLLSRMDEGLPKLWVIKQALAVRSRHCDGFSEQGSYVPLEVAGEKAEHAVAFQRGPAVAVIVPRVSSAVAGEWGDASVELPAGSWTNALTTARLAGGKISLGELLKNFPVALLTRN